MRVAFLPGELTCTGKFFGSLPAALLRQAGYDATCDISRLPDVSLIDAGSRLVPHDPRFRDCDAVVLIRPPVAGLCDFVRSMKASGTLVVHCVDDWLFGEGPRAGLYGGKGLAEVIHSYRLADAFLASTPSIARNLRVFAKPVVVQPIALWDDHWAEVRHVPSADGTVRIGWHGVGWIRPGDLRTMGRAIRRILDDLPETSFVAVGDRHTLGILGIDGHPRSSYEHLMPLEVLPRSLARLDVGLAPLVRSEANACKTPLKPLEIMAAGAVPVTAGWQPEYQRVVHHGENGFLAIRPHEWYERIRELVRDESLRRRFAGRGTRDAAGHLASANTESLLASFEDVLRLAASSRRLAAAS